MSNPWEIDTAVWPPRAPVLTRYGATTFEVARSCALRVSFQYDRRFPSRTAPSAIIGSAIHAALEATGDTAYASLSTRKERYNYLEKVFAERLKLETANAARSFRNLRPLSEEEIVQRSRRALLAIAREAPQATAELPEASAKSGRLPSKWTTLREIEVRDTDSGLVGVIDRIQRSAGETVITDFKATARDDVPERYANQVKLYAALWHLNQKEWPSYAELRYLLNNATHRVPVEPTECTALLASARSLPQVYAGRPPAHDLASPGDVCKVCSYRPWCQPFWSFRAEQDCRSGQIASLTPSGFEGVVQRLEMHAEEIVFRVRWGTKFTMVHVPKEDFPQAANVRDGFVIRVLDVKVTGQAGQPTVRLNQDSELYYLVNANQ